MIIKNVVINRWFVFSEYLSRYLQYPFLLLLVILFFYSDFNLVMQSVIIVMLLTLPTEVMYFFFIKEKAIQNSLEFCETSIKLINYKGEVKIINNIEGVKFIITEHANESVFGSFRNKSGLNKLEIKSNHRNMRFLIKLNSKKEYDRLIRNIESNSFSYSLILKNKFIDHFID